MKRRSANRKNKTVYTMHEIARLQALHKTVAEISEIVGLGEETVVSYLQDPQYEVIRDKVIGESFALVDEHLKMRKVSVILDDAAPDASDALIELLQATRVKLGEDGRLVGGDPVEARLTACAILDRAGWGPVQRRAIRARVELDPALAHLFKQALKESALPGEVVDVEVVRREG